MFNGKTFLPKKVKSKLDEVHTATAVTTATTMTATATMTTTTMITTTATMTTTPTTMTTTPTKPEATLKQTQAQTQKQGKGGKDDKKQQGKGSQAQGAGGNRPARSASWIHTGQVRESATAMIGSFVWRSPVTFAPLSVQIRKDTRTATAGPTLAPDRAKHPAPS